MEEARGFALGRMRDILRIDNVEDEDELDKLWVEAAAGAIVDKLDDADGE
jgi:hypothetical protein